MGDGPAQLNEDEGADRNGLKRNLAFLILRMLHQGEGDQSGLPAVFGRVAIFDE